MKRDQIGFWDMDKVRLPYFNYEGKIPYHKILSNGTKVKLPEDPWFILGNYQLTIFPHVSGEYELITGQRTWGRMNIGDKVNSGNNKSTFTYCRNDEKAVDLVGIESLAADENICQRLFGCGFAEYRYEFDDFKVTRNLSVKPSSTPYNGASAMIMTIEIENLGEDVEVSYQEELAANYVQIQYQYVDEDKRQVKYNYYPNADINNQYLEVCIEKDVKDPLLIEDEKTISRFEGYPPKIFFKSLTPTQNMKIEERTLSATYSYLLKKNEKVTIQLVIGFGWNKGACTIDNILKEMCTNHSFEKGLSYYSKEWREIIPTFEDEKDDVFKREMQWNTYVLEAMATYSDYYKETKIPQGTVYDYDWGQHLSARDNFQHALPLLYYNPELARSVLRYMLKRTTPYGEIRLAEYGFGNSDNTYYLTSDQQLFFFLLLGEYLKVTKDYKFLLEDITPYPADERHKMKVYELVKNCYVFLRDSINVGDHGLIKLLNSDWNDAIFYIVKEPYNRVFNSGESHMNTAMGITTLQTLIPELENAIYIFDNDIEKENLKVLCESMKIYRQRILDAFLKELEGRTFSKRMYFAGKSYGEDNMFLEPQCYALQINELSNEQKTKLYDEMQRRVYQGEVLGAREQQAPEFEDPEFDKGSRENGGFWWALNGPIIMAMNKMNKEEAWKLLKNMTFDNYSNHFPEYWSSYWSASDNVESSLIPEEGLPDQSENYACIPIFCAHPHAWPLFLYYLLKE